MFNNPQTHGYFYWKVRIFNECFGFFFYFLGVIDFDQFEYLLYAFFILGEALELSEQYTGTGTPDIVTLRHPNTGESAIFLFSPANNSVQEVLTFNEGKRSWFIDESVKSDGKMHLSTPIDPIFLGMLYFLTFMNNVDYIHTSNFRM